MRELIKRIPMLGPILHWVYALLRLNTIRRQIAQDLDELRRMQQVNHTRLDRLDRLNIDTRLDRLDRLNIDTRLDRLDRLNIDTRLDRLDRLNIDTRLDRLDGLNIDTRLDRLDGLNIDTRLDRLDDLNLGHRLNSLEALNVGYRLNRLDALDIANRLHVFDLINIANRLNRLESGAAIKGVAAATEAPGFDQDGFYVEFENAFRGDFEAIQRRQSVYLPYLAEATKAAGTAEAHVVDVGCGRGEWLELLKAQPGIQATGIDLNAAMVRICQQRGLTALCSDAMTYLHAQPAASLAAVTGFHIIEHLSFAKLIELLDAALQALRPGGLVIFETPNPENLQVGACSFHTDPTHRRPIVPMVAEFLARQRGFAETRILRLHPCPEDRRLSEKSQTAERLNQVLYGEQDYALLAWKAQVG